MTYIGALELTDTSVLLTLVDLLVRHTLRWCQADRSRNLDDTFSFFGVTILARKFTFCCVKMGVDRSLAAAGIQPAPLRADADL